MSFIERLDFEYDFYMEKGYFPYFSILINSLYFRATEFALERFDAKYILPIAVGPHLDDEMLARKIAEFLRVPMPEAVKPLPHNFNISGIYKFVDDSFDRPASREKYGDFFDRDVTNLTHALTQHGCDLTLFNARKLLTDSVSPALYAS